MTRTDVVLRIALVLSSSLVLACSGGSSSDESKTGGSETINPPQAEVGADTAWPELTGAGQAASQGLVSQLHQCNQADQRTCAVQVMQQAGASQHAIDFYSSTGWFLTDVKEYGPLAVGTIVNPWRANANTQYALLNGNPEVVYIEEQGPKLLLSKDEAYAALQAAFPPGTGPMGSENLILFEADNAFEGAMEAPDGGQRFIFRYNVVNGCHACGTGYWERAGLDFDTNGVYKTITPLGLCHMPSTPARLPGVEDCPPAVR